MKPKAVNNRLTKAAVTPKPERNLLSIAASNRIRKEPEFCVRLQEVGDSSEFEIESRERPRERPKQKPKAKLAKRNFFISMAKEDSEMLEKKLSIASVAECSQGEPTYLSAADIIAQFNFFVLQKTKAPIAYEITKLTKAMTAPADIVRVFTLDLLRKCATKVTALQEKKTGLAERDVAIEIVGVGVYATSTLGIMRKWHRARNAIANVDKALNWIDSIDFTLGTITFITSQDPELPDKLKALPILSEHVSCQMYFKSCPPTDAVCLDDRWKP